MGGGPSNFIVNQSPNLWIFGFKTFDLDFGLDISSLVCVLYWNGEGNQF